MPPECPLLMLVERFLREADMPPTTFGRRVCRDPQFVGDLRRGRTPGPEVRGRVEHFMNKWRQSRHGQPLPAGRDAAQMQRSHAQ